MSAVSKNRSTLQPYKLIDIGSGDGRIVRKRFSWQSFLASGCDWIPVLYFQVIEAASRGFKAHGVELNLWLVLYSKFRAFKMGLRGSATFARQDLWKTDFSPYQRIVVFGVEEMVTLFLSYIISFLIITTFVEIVDATARNEAGLGSQCK